MPRWGRPLGEVNNLNCIKLLGVAVEVRAIKALSIDHGEAAAGGEDEGKHEQESMNI